MHGRILKLATATTLTTQTKCDSSAHKKRIIFLFLLLTVRFFFFFLSNLVFSFKICFASIRLSGMENFFLLFSYVFGSKAEYESQIVWAIKVVSRLALCYSFGARKRKYYMKLLFCKRCSNFTNFNLMKTSLKWELLFGTRRVSDIKEQEKSKKRSPIIHTLISKVRNDIWVFSKQSCSNCVPITSISGPSVNNENVAFRSWNKTCAICETSRKMS